MGKEIDLLQNYLLHVGVETDKHTGAVSTLIYQVSTFHQFFDKTQQLNLM